MRPNTKIRWEKFRQSYRYVVNSTPNIQILKHLRMVLDMQTKHLGDWTKVPFFSGYLGILKGSLSLGQRPSSCVCLGDTRANEALPTILVNENMVTLTHYSTQHPNQIFPLINKNIFSNKNATNVLRNHCLTFKIKSRCSKTGKKPWTSHTPG